MLKSLLWWLAQRPLYRLGFDPAGVMLRGIPFDDAAVARIKSRNTASSVWSADTVDSLISRIERDQKPLPPPPAPKPQRPPMPPRKIAEPPAPAKREYFA